MVGDKADRSVRLLHILLCVTSVLQAEWLEPVLGVLPDWDSLAAA